jgi:hypothetical protein
MMMMTSQTTDVRGRNSKITLPGTLVRSTPAQRLLLDLHDLEKARDSNDAVIKQCREDIVLAQQTIASHEDAKASLENEIADLKAAIKLLSSNGG